ncbi:hypothetical protein BDZ91DRAFT_715149 [Kalaharituber pfeilii]|nr:hypothetical protein BDZ91DRAFT_715149 [Kalaharituber pfeilii]
MRSRLLPRQALVWSIRGICKKKQKGKEKRVSVYLKSQDAVIYNLLLPLHESLDVTLALHCLGESPPALIRTLGARKTYLM